MIQPSITSDNKQLNIEATTVRVILQGRLPDSVTDQDEAIDGLFRCLTFTVPDACGGDYEGAMDVLFADLQDTLDMFRGNGCKFFLGTDIEMSKMLEDATAMMTFRTKSTVLLNADDSLNELFEHVQRLSVKVDDFVREGSGWISHKVERVYLYITKLDYLQFFEIIN